MNQKKKRNYERKMQKALSEHKNFLMSIIREEWSKVPLSLKQESTPADIPGTMTKIVFALVNAGGTLTVIEASDKVLHVAGQIFGTPCFFEKLSFQKSIRYLGRKKYIQAIPRKGGWTLHLTERGAERMLVVAYNHLRLKKIDPWDRVWRVIFFDIPNVRKWARDGLRKKLKEMNFLKLQKSVFVTPYPCKEEIKFLTSFYGISHCVRIIETNFLGGDAEIKRSAGVQ